MRTSGQIEMRCTALEPIHHGAGSSGNTQLLRMQEMIDAEGREVRVPFISGNSMKHRIRYHAVKYALDVLEVDDSALSKPEIDLLMSGGHLSKTAGAVDLTRARKLERLFPAISMCGFSAGNTMTESKLSCSHLHLVCDENRWRLPADLADSPHALLRSRKMRSEEFGTRHDKGQSQDAVRYLTSGDVAQLEADASDKLKRSKSSKTKDSGDKGQSAQMLYDFQVVKAGSRFYGTIRFRELTDLEMAALASAFHYATHAWDDDKAVMHLGAKSSVGFGSVSVELSGSVRSTPTEYSPSTAIVGDDGADRAKRYNAHLHEHRDEILSAVREAVR